MPMVTITEQIEAAEAHLRDAMLAGDVKALDDLLADDLVFTNQVGQCLTKADDLAAHSSGRLRITQLDISDQRVRPAETFAVVTLVANVGGSFDGQAFSGAFTYTRVWERADGRWRVLAVHCSAVAY
jgi:ketosteroid isomerase-like protein